MPDIQMIERLGSFGVVVWIVWYVFTKSMPAFLAQLDKYETELDRQRGEFSVELNRQRGEFSTMLIEQRLSHTESMERASARHEDMINKLLLQIEKLEIKMDQFASMIYRNRAQDSLEAAKIAPDTSEATTKSSRVSQVAIVDSKKEGSDAQ